MPNANEQSTIIFPETELIDGCLRSYAFCDTTSIVDPDVNSVDSIYYTIEYGYEQSYTAIFVTPITLICGNDHRWYWNGLELNRIYCGNRRSNVDDSLSYNLVDSKKTFVFE